MRGQCKAAAPPLSIAFSESAATRHRWSGDEDAEMLIERIHERRARARSKGLRRIRGSRALSSELRRKAMQQQNSA
jgi:hypothetical protein